MRAKNIKMLKNFPKFSMQSLQNKIFLSESSISWSLRNMCCIKGLRLANLASNMWTK
jgi:hypothetical protein